MLTVKSMEFASFSLGLLGIIASLLVLGGPSPGPGVLPKVPSAQTCLQWLVTPPKIEDFPSNANWNCLQLGPPSDMTCLHHRFTRQEENSSFTINCQQWVPLSDMTCLHHRFTRQEENSSITINCQQWVPRSDMTCLQWHMTPEREEDFTSDMTCLQWVLSLDGGFSDTVNKALGFPDMVLVTSVIHVLANVGLLYGIFQSNSCFLVVFILYYYIVTYILAFIFTTLAVCNVSPYESLLVAMCLLPMESSMILLYGKSWFLPVFMLVMRSILFLSTVKLMEKMDGVKKKITPASEIKIQGDLVIQV